MKKPSSFNELSPNEERHLEREKGKSQSRLLNKSNIFTPIGHDQKEFVKSSLQTVDNWAGWLFRSGDIPRALIL